MYWFITYWWLRLGYPFSLAGWMSAKMLSVYIVNVHGAHIFFVKLWPCLNPLSKAVERIWMVWIKIPLFIVSINLDCGNRVGRERIASATSRHSRACGLELEIAFFVTCRSTANFNLSQNKSLHKRERRPRLQAPETDVPSNKTHRWRLKVMLGLCYFYYNHL